jgi:hypothetical protein
LAFPPFLPIRTVLLVLRRSVRKAAAIRALLISAVVCVRMTIACVVPVVLAATETVVRGKLLIVILWVGQ